MISPFAHYIRITNKCNNNCLFCNVDKTQKESPAQVRAAILKTPKETREVVLTGGEPTIDKMLFKYIEMITNTTSASITIQTNGLMFSYKEYTDKLESSGVGKIVISFPALGKEKYCMLTYGDFNILEMGLLNLSGTAMELELNFLINSYNYQDLETFALWLIATLIESLNMNGSQRISKHSKRYSNVVLILYWGEDAFTKYVAKNIPEIRIMKFDLRINSENEMKGLTIPNDGHPTGKANIIISKVLATMIANDKMRGDRIDSLSK